MARQVTHLSNIRTYKSGMTVTGTLCNRMHGTGDINCTTDESEVTCKFCLNRLAQLSERKNEPWARDFLARAEG